jgi:hypothetical protein
MTQTISFRALAALLGGCLVLAACNGVSPSAQPTTAPQISNLSGDYSGTMDDEVEGSGAINGTLAQHGSTAGGDMNEALIGGTFTAQVSLAVGSNNALNGAIVVDYPNNGPTCTYKTTGTYSNNGTTAATITGSYTAVTNCLGDSGTFTLNQQCTDTITSDSRRPMGFPPAC